MKARHIALYFAGIKNKGVIIFVMVAVYVYFESTENNPNMDITKIFSSKKIVHRVFGSRYHCRMARYSNINQNPRAATANFYYSQGSKQWLIINQLLFSVKIAMECTGKKFGLLQGRKTASLKFGLLDEFFSFSPKGVVLVFTKKNQKSSHVQREPITRRRLP